MQIRISRVNSTKLGTLARIHIQNRQIPKEGPQGLSFLIRDDLILFSPGERLSRNEVYLFYGKQAEKVLAFEGEYNVTHEVLGAKNGAFCIDIKDRHPTHYRHGNYSGITHDRKPPRKFPENPMDALLELYDQAVALREHYDISDVEKYLLTKIQFGRRDRAAQAKASAVLTELYIFTGNGRKESAARGIENWIAHGQYKPAEDMAYLLLKEDIYNG